MATAAVNLKEHVTCPVCLEIYEEPRILKCLHTICEACMNSVQKYNSVACPVCREKTPISQVKSDFKTKALLELYNGPDKSPTKTNKTTKKSKAEPGRIIAQMCMICKRQEISTYCRQCKVLICNPCKNSHNRIPSCSEHTFGLDTYRRDQAAQLLEAVKGIEETGIGSTNEQLRFDGQVRELEMQAIEEVKEAEKRAISEVKRHHQNLIGLIQLRKFKILSTRAKQKETLKSLSVDLRERVGRYTKEMTENSDAGEVTLDKIAEDALKSTLFEQEINQLKKKYSAESCACRTIIHVRDQPYNEDTGTKVIFKERAQRCLIQ